MVTLKSLHEFNYVSKDKELQPERLSFSHSYTWCMILSYFTEYLYAVGLSNLVPYNYTEVETE